MATKRARTTCVDCGAPKDKRWHFLVQRCEPCREGFNAAYLRAGRAVTAAKASGKLLPASAFACVDCGEPATDYDHRDYSRPLDVQPVCRSCNFRRGAALWKPAA